MIGTILGGRYEIIEEIGNGGMAHVYKARCTLLNRIVAVKILREDLEGETEFLKRFNVEAQAAASLAHSNIVSIFDVGCDNGRHYIIMEYVDGITLKEYISEKQRLEYREALSIAYQISGALQAAHQKNIVHRDIKPHNILVTEDGRIKVTDFGIARSSTHKTISSNGDIIGSVHYISPEQAKGETVDTRSDIYSLGIVIHEMITGKVPFDGDSPVAVAMMQIESKANNRALAELDVPVSVQQIIFKAISKEPELRYQDADEIKSDILNVLHDVNFKIANGDIYMDFDDDNNGGGEFSDKGVRPVKSLFVRTLLIIAAFLTSFAIVMFATHLYVNGVPDMPVLGFGEKTVKVPDLTGMTLADAKEECNSLKLNIVVTDEMNDENHQPGTIISQSPHSDAEIDENGTVNVVINKNNEMVVLGDYTGSDYKTVQDELEDAGHTVNVVFEESKKQPDTILRQTPQSGKKVKDDSIITLYVSSGINSANKYITVPNLVGKTYSQGTSTLKSLGLSIGHTSSVKPQGSDVIKSQTIPAGSLVEKESVVAVTVQTSRSDEEAKEPASGRKAETPDNEESGSDEKSKPDNESPADKESEQTSTSENNNDAVKKSETENSETRLNGESN